ncbi:MAG: hypothetical protein HRU29_02730 [Rhizobiales bacterium]|nr:HlyU family transcriptional regulator [Hyphomicrobiales bacterium]NRB13294.1 hypothetical protein [Hyphomicrobiales bacterium]
MSFFKKLFGRSKQNKSTADGVDKIIGEETYLDYTIQAIEMKQSGEYILAGIISKNIGDEVKTHKFIRADRLHGQEQAVSTTIKKGQQIIDQQGDSLFR